MPTRRYRRAAPAVSLVAVSMLAFGLSSAQPLRRTGLDIELRRIDDGLYLHLGRQEEASVANAADIANLVVVVGDASVTIIDPGGGAAISTALRSAVRRLTDLPVSHVVLSHAHPDHVFGAAVFAGRGKDSPVVIAHQRFERARALRRDTDLARLGALLPAGPALLPTVTLAAGARHDIELGGRRLSVRALPPAHTDHDLLVIDGTTGTLIASDVVVAQRLPSLDGSLLGWLAVLDEIDGWPIERIVPGHGRPGRPAALLEPMTTYLTSLRDGVRAGIARGESLGTAVRRAESASTDAGGWLLHALHHPFNVTRAWSELEWE